MQGYTRGTIHPTAVVSDRATLGRNVTVGANALIYDSVELGDDVVVGPYAILGEPLGAYYRDDSYENPRLSVGSGTVIRSRSILYAGSTIGEHVQCGHNVLIREMVRLGHHASVGSLSDLEGHCEIGSYTRIHSNVHVAQETRIGNYVWIFPYTVFTNDPYPPSNVVLGVNVEDFAVIATKSVLLPGVRIGRDAVVGAMSLVRSDVPAETLVAGNPAKPVGKIHQIFNLRTSESGEAVYPWREHFERGMPWEGIGFQRWKELQADGQP